MGLGLDERETPILAGLAASATVFYLAPWPPLYGIAFLVLAALTWYRLDLALPLAIVFAPLFMLPKHIGHEEFAPSEILIGLDVVVAAFWAVDGRSRLAWRRLFQSPILLPAILLVAAGATATLFAADRHVALRAYREVMLEPVVLFGLLTLVETKLARWRLVFGAVLAAGLLVALVGLVQRATHQDLTVDTGSTIEKIRSVYGSPDNVGLFLDRVIPIWLAVALVARLWRWQWVVWLPAGVILLAALLLSYSRGAWLAIAIAGLAMLVIARPWGRWVALACVVVALGALAIKEPAIKQAFTAGHTNTVQERLYLWKSSARMIRDHPLVGIGPDNFLHYYAPTRKQDPYSTCLPGLGYLDRQYAGREPCLSHPHDEFLDFWLSTGVLGLAAFVWLEIVLWISIAGAYPASSGASRALLLGAGGAMLAGLVHGLVDNGYFLIDLAIVFWVLCAFVGWAIEGREN